jgi:glucosamine--fructose-6-phosphate aminotransferase (isomerizing)
MRELADMLLKLLKLVFITIDYYNTLQLLSYHIAVMRGCNVDQPRNLARWWHIGAGFSKQIY